MKKRIVLGEGIPVPVGIGSRSWMGIALISEDNQIVDLTCDPRIFLWSTTGKRVRLIAEVLGEGK